MNTKITIFFLLFSFQLCAQTRSFMERRYFAAPDDSVWTFKGYRTIIVEPIDTATYTYTLSRAKKVWQFPSIVIAPASFVSQSGIVVVDGVLGGVDKSDWIRYSIDFRGERKSIEYEYAMSDATSGSVEFRIGSTTAAPIAKMILPVTGGWGTFTTMTIPINPSYSAGSVDLYVTFSESARTTGSGGNIRKIVIK